MQKMLNLYGIGNALVDLQINVEDEIIHKLGISKGEMRLVDDKLQSNIIEQLKDKKINICSGGSAANTVVAFAGFGGKAAYNTILGNDEFGTFYANEFKELDIHLIAPCLDNKSTGTCLVLISPDSERTMITSLAVNEELNENHLSEEYIAKSEWIYLEGYKFSNPNSSKALKTAAEMAKDNNTKISFTFSDTFITGMFKPEIEKVLEHTNLIFCNEHEAMSFTGKDNTEAAFKELCKTVPNVSVTLGRHGSVIYWDKEKITVPPYPAERVDTTGAGDMFAGAFLYGITHFNSAEKAGHLASVASAKIVSIMGARLNENPQNLLDKLKV